MKKLSILKPRQVGIWIRVSTEMQNQGDSPQHHEARAREFANSRNWTVVKIYHLEAVSGKSVIGHSETKRMIEDVKSGIISGLIVSKFARIVRKTKELLEISDIFQDYNAELISIEEPINISTSTGRLFLSVFGALVEWEREEIGARVSASIPIRAKLGKPLGGAATFGYRWEGKKMIIDENESPVRKMMYELFIIHKRKKKVAFLLNEAGYRTRNGSLFTDTTIDRLLRDPTAKGLRRANYTASKDKSKAWVVKPESEWIMVPVDPIVKEELWEQANQILETQRSRLTRKGPKPKVLFAGLVFCCCGNRMYMNRSKYYCSVCRNKAQNIYLEQFFLNSINELFSQKRIKILIQRAKNDLVEKIMSHSKTLEEKKLNTAEMDKCYSLFVKSKLDQDDFLRYYTPLKNKQRILESKVAVFESEIEALNYWCVSELKTTEQAIKIINLWWPNATLVERVAFTENFVKKINISEKFMVIEFHHLSSFPHVEGFDFRIFGLICGLTISVKFSEKIDISKIKFSIDDYNKISEISNIKIA